MKKVCLFSLDVEEDLVDGKSIERFDGVKHLPTLLPLIEEHDIHPTLFCTGRVLSGYASVLKDFTTQGEIGLHGFFDHVNMQEQNEEDRRVLLQKHIEVFEGTFGYRPQGFRAVQNTIDEVGFNLLQTAGLVYDSSIVSRYVPFKTYVGYTGKAPREPYFPQEGNLLQKGDKTLFEIPLSPPLLGVQLQGKWIQGLGTAFYKKWLRIFAPQFLSLSFHSWDLVLSDGTTKNTKFLSDLNELVILLKDLDYTFLSAQEIYEQFSTS